MQTKKHSILETVANVGSGFIIVWILSLIIVPMFDSKNFSAFDGFILTSIFTISSVIRSYTWRRTFNHWSKL